MISQLNKYGIKTAIASGPTPMIEAYQNADHKRFIGGYYFSPRYPFPDTTELISLIKTKKIQVLGELGLPYAD